jgi:hypothetical protein
MNFVLSVGWFSILSNWFSEIDWAEIITERLRKMNRVRSCFWFIVKHNLVDIAKLIF